MPNRVELRVHGVSGTPAKQLLYWDPVSYLDQGEKTASETRTWERNRDDRPTSTTLAKAFHWGSLTSGSKLSAFWILLAPFAFSNIAGWMADGHRRTQAFLRLAALGLTGLFAAQASVVGIDYVFQLVAGGALDLWVAYLAPATLGLVLFVGGWRLSTRSQLANYRLSKQATLIFGTTRQSLLPDPVLAGITFGDDRIDELLGDPAPGAQMSNSKLWIQQPVLHRLRRQHLSAAILIVGLVVAWASDRAPLVWAALAILGVISAATVVTYSDGIGKKFSVWVARVIVYPSLVIFALSIAFSRPELVQVGVGSESTHLVVFFTAGIALFGAFGAVLSQLATRHRRTAFLPFGTTAIAMMMGGALGVAAALMAEVAIYRWAPKLSSSEAFQIGNDFEIVEAQVMVNGGGWISIAMLTFLIGILGTAGVLAFFPMRGLPAKREGRKLAMLTRVTGRAQILIGTAGVLGIVLAAIAGLDACLPDGCSPSSLFLSGENPQIAFILVAVAVPSVLAFAAAVWRVNIIASVILITVSIGTGWFVWVDDPPFREINIPGVGLAVDLSQLVDLAFVVIILGFGLSILRSILGGFGDPERRRKVGVLWDIGSFWPRWFHPLAPPAYGPAAVRALRSALIEENKRAKTTGQPLILAAHSQGSVIAAVALSKSLAKPSGLVTYGSPLGHLYSQMFPATGVDDLCEIVDQKLRDFLAKPDQQDPPGHWLNLRRPATDYIGESPTPQCTNWTVETGIGHSGYELTPEFCMARKVSIAGVKPEPGVVPLDCWET